MDKSGRVILEFTYAEYSRESPLLDLSMIALSFIPHCIPIIVAAQGLALRSRHHFFFFLGLVISHESAKFLKKVWKQPRPVGAYMTSYGMPSDHSQFVFFTTCYLAIEMLANPKLRKSGVYRSIGSLVFLSSLVCLSRLYLGVHTVEQVLVGSGFGVVLGCVWNYLTKKYLLSSKFLAIVFARTFALLERMFYSRIHLKG